MYFFITNLLNHLNPRFFSEMAMENNELSIALTVGVGWSVVFGYIS